MTSYDRETLSTPSPLLSLAVANLAYRLGFYRGAKWAAENPGADLPPCDAWETDAPSPRELGLTERRAALPRFRRAALARYVYGCVSGAEQPGINRSLGIGPPPSPKAGTCYKARHVHPLMAPDGAWEIGSLSEPDPDVPRDTAGSRAWLYLGTRRIDGSPCYVWEAVDGPDRVAVAQTLVYVGPPR